MGRERRCQHARRRATDAIERQAELRLADSRFDPVRDIRRVDDNDVSADRLELGHEFRAPDDVDGLQATRFRESVRERIVISAGGLSALPADADPQQLAMLAINPGGALEALARQRFIGAALWAMREPAQAAGLEGEHCGRRRGDMRLTANDEVLLHRPSPQLAQRLSYSSWRRHQTPVSLRPLGARSSHWYMPQRPSSPRA